MSVEKRKRIEQQPHVELMIPPDGLDCDVVGITTDGQLVTLQSVLIAPFFYAGGAAPSVLHVRVLRQGGEVYQRLTLSMAPNTGKLKLTDRSRRVAPKFDTRQVKPNGNGNGHGPSGTAPEKKP